MQRDKVSHPMNDQVCLNLAFNLHDYDEDATPLLESLDP